MRLLRTSFLESHFSGISQVFRMQQLQWSPKNGIGFALDSGNPAKSVSRCLNGKEAPMRRFIVPAFVSVLLFSSGASAQYYQDSSAVVVRNWYRQFLHREAGPSG